VITRVFAYEYTGAIRPEESGLIGSLQTEGAAMLSAILADLGRIPGIDPITLRNRPAQEEENVFRALARSAAFTLVIAPESDDLLLSRCRWVEECGSRLLGPSPAAVQLTGDKLVLSQYLRREKVPTPECRRIAPDMPVCPFAFPVICKPRCGAGSVATFLVRNLNEWEHCHDLGRAEGWEGENVVQPFVPGQAASVAFLVGSSQPVALLPATQELSADGRFRYRGGRLPLPSPQAERAVLLAGRAVQVVPGLRGYVGVDVVLGEAADGSQDWVIEINPRLTTSYIGLRVLARLNLAEAMLRAVRGEEIPNLQWFPGPIRFQSDGTVLEGT
jgi:predicted ATP-grasp superfamily ATP-dependent carboligase